MSKFGGALLFVAHRHKRDRKEGIMSKSRKYMIMLNNEPMFIRVKKGDHHVCIKARAGFTHSKAHADIRFATKRECKNTYSTLISAMNVDATAAFRTIIGV